MLGVLVLTGEYTTGMIRSTLAAVPRRLPVLWAKGVVLAVSIFVVSSVAVALSLGVMQLFLGAVGAVLGPWQGYGVLPVWVVVFLARAAALLRRRYA